MPKYRPKSLILWDLDNTLTDSARFWGVATGAAINATIKTFGLERETVRTAVLRAPSQYRFSDFGSLLRWLGDEKILPEPASPADAYNLKARQWGIRQMWYRKQKEMTVFYPGTVSALRTIHAHGTKMVIYTDTEASSLIRRMWLLAQNGVKDGSLSDEMEIFKLFDHFYSQPSIEDDFEILKDVDTHFIHALKQKLSIFTPDPRTGLERRKPSAAHVARILQDYEAAPKHALMVGDSDKDGGSARLGGIDFAWVKFGAKLDRETVQTARTMASPNFKYGLKAIQDALKTQGIVPTVTLQKNLTEILKKFDFISGPGFNPCSAESAPDCRHRHETPDTQNAAPTVHRLGPLFHSQARQSPTGPATHFPPAPKAPAQSGPSGRAGPEKPDPLPGPKPV